MRPFGTLESGHSRKSLGAGFRVWGSGFPNEGGRGRKGL